MNIPTEYLHPSTIYISIEHALLVVLQCSPLFCDVTLSGMKLCSLPNFLFV